MSNAQQARGAKCIQDWKSFLSSQPQHGNRRRCSRKPGMAVYFRDQQFATAFVQAGRKRWHRSIVVSAAAPQAAQLLSVTVEKAPKNSRRLYASIDIAAPIKVVWQALTSYDNLADFIPGLAENRCLERRQGGAQLLQVGQQDLALGAKFKATVVLDIQEYESGVPLRLCLQRGENGASPSGSEDLFPQPLAIGGGGSPRDIAFSMVKGDFQAFRGIWRMQERQAESTLLSYSLHVRPQPWLPVALIQSRIEGEVKMNLSAVRDYSERQHKSQGQ